MSQADHYERDIHSAIDYLKRLRPEDLFAFAEWLAQSPDARGHEHVAGLVIMLLHRLGSQAQARAIDPGPPEPLGQPADLPDHLREE